MNINVKAPTLCSTPWAPWSYGNEYHFWVLFYVVFTRYKIKYTGKSFLLRKHIYLSFSQMPQNNLSQTFQVELAHLQPTPNPIGLFQFEIKNPLTK